MTDFEDIKYLAANIKLELQDICDGDIQLRNVRNYATAAYNYANDITAAVEVGLERISNLNYKVDELTQILAKAHSGKET